MASKVLLLLNMPPHVRQEYYEHFSTAFPALHFDVADHHSRVAPYIADAEILITFGAQMHDSVLEQGVNLKWIQLLGTGVDGVLDRPILRDAIHVTNMHGLHGASMPESALLFMLALGRDLPRSLRSQGARKWDRFPARLLQHKTAGILGVGAIAEDLAPKLKLFGMRVVGISSVPRQLPGFDQMVARDDLAAVVSDLDYLILLTPYSPATHEIVSAAVIAAMKPTSYLINLARGGVVDEAALIDALRHGRIAGAGLDVFATEPLPADHPFWAMENVIVTPHLGGFHDAYAGEAFKVVDENLRRYVAGDRANMINIVRGR